MDIARPSSFLIGKKRLALPAFFPSVSSVKTALLPEEYLQLLASLTGVVDKFLMSAFDLDAIERPNEAMASLMKARQGGSIALMDSGNYESFWKDAKSRWTQEKFHDTLARFPFDLAFAFDEQSPPSANTEHLDLVVSGWHRDQRAAGECYIVPIVHSSAGELPGLCAAVAKTTGVKMIAVAERRLGEGFLQRFETVGCIRKALNGLGRYVALHLLGTGNPISIASYVAAGADSFDGLEWCQTAVDHESGLLHHLSHADFFAAQTSWTDAELSFQARTLAHNLEFFTGWMTLLREAVIQNRVPEFCRLHFSPRVFAHVAKKAKWRAE
jgi:queuine/archaeosine tRNA-ribosyltransferase